MDKCLSLYTLLEQVSSVQAPLLLSQFAGCLVQGSACAYCGASIVFAFRDVGDEDHGANIYLSRALYSATFILTGALIALRIFYSCRAGQAIEDEMLNCK